MFRKPQVTKVLYLKSLQNISTQA